jgi:tape measure domain-containing protein
MAKDIKVALELDNRQFQRSINQSKNSVKDFEQTGSKSLSNLRNAFLALGGAALIKNIVEVGQTFQDLQTSLDFVTGSASAGAVAFDNLTTLATQTQFGVEELVQTFIRLKGAGIEPTNDLLLTFADTASLAQDQLGVLTALTELFARGATKGKLELEDFNKIAERGVDVFKPLTKEFGMSIQEIQKLAQTAQGQERLFTGIQKALDDTYGGALQEKLKNSSVAFSNLEIAARRLANTVFKELGLGSTSAINGLTDAINRLADNTEAIKSFGKVLAGLLGVFLAFRAVKGITAIMNKFEDGLKSLLTRAQKGGKSFTGLKEAIRGLGLKSETSKLDSFDKTLGKTNPSLLKSAKNAFTFSGGLATLGKTLLRTTGYGLAAVTAFEALKFVFLAIKGPAEEAKETFEQISRVEMGGIHEQLFLQQEAARMAKEEVAKLNAEYNDLTDNDTLFDMDTQEPINKLKAFADEIDDSLGGIDEYNRLMVLFNGLFGDPKTIADMEERQSALNDLNSSYSDLFDPLDALNEVISDGVDTQAEYNVLQKELNRLQELGIFTTDELTEAQNNLDEAFGDNEGLLSFINTLNQATDTLSDDLATALMEGKGAMDSFKGFFKTLVQQVIADALKLLLIIPILEAIGFSTMGGSITGLSGKGFLGSLGFKQTGIGGGNLMPNRPVLVGEAGPEIFYPASSGSLSPNAMATQVTYNIQAVDAPSFQALVARDPEFIYSVTRAGQRRLPGAR